MTVPFFDSNPGLVNELRAMDHNSKEYKKLLRKVLLEMGGMVYLFNYLKSTDEGNSYRKKYFRNLIVTGSLIITMFVWIAIAWLLTGGKDTDQFTGTDMALFIGFITIEIANIVIMMLLAFRCRRILLQGVSFTIDNYSYENNGNIGSTLGNYNFQRAKLSKISVVVAVLVFVVIFGVRALSNGTINALLPSHTQDFSKAGLTITLTQDFHEKDVVSQTATYASSKYIVLTLKEEFKILEQSNISTDISLKEYAEDIIANNSLDATVEGNESRPYFIYSRQASGKDITYLATVFKGSDAFWIVTFACDSKNFASSQAQFMKWADTVKVS
jgi:hypothetical protein